MIILPTAFNATVTVTATDLYDEVVKCHSLKQSTVSAEIFSVVTWITANAKLKFE